MYDSLVHSRVRVSSPFQTFRANEITSATMAEAMKPSSVLENGAASNKTISGGASSGRSAYVPPHRRNNRTASKNASDSNHQKHLDVLDKALTRVCCINLKENEERWVSIKGQVKRIGKSFCDKLERFQAIDGRQVLKDGVNIDGDVKMDWDATINASYSRKAVPGKRTMMSGEVGCALSHITLWKELAATFPDYPNDTMLILEDDAMLSTLRGKNRFAAAFGNAWKQLPEDWSILYLGLSDRGERAYVDQLAKERWHPLHNPEVRLYRPEYGYHTHAYVIKKAAARILVESLPVVGPIDVWLGDNQWFGLHVYSAVISNEGWRLADGTYEGMELVIQNRKAFSSDVQQSSS